MNDHHFVVTLNVIEGHMVNWSSEGMDLENSIRPKGVRLRNWIVLGWHYPSGEPWYKWVSDRFPGIGPASEKAGRYVENIKRVSTRVSILGRDKDMAAILKNVYFEKHFRNYPHEFKDHGLLWNGTAHKYTWDGNEYYLIEKRAADDASLITCTEGADACRIRGARVNDYLIAEGILIKKTDLENWRRYQELVKSEVKKMFVSVKPKSK